MEINLNIYHSFWDGQGEKTIFVIPSWTHHLQLHIDQHLEMIPKVSNVKLKDCLLPIKQSFPQNQADAFSTLSSLHLPPVFSFSGFIG